MTLTVLSVSYPLAPVSRDAVGGAEQVIAHLDSALVRAGHNSIVIAPESSSVSGTLIPIPEIRGVLDERAREAAHAHVRRAIHGVLKRSKVDIVHLHGIDFASYLPEAGVPILATLHLPLDWYPQHIFALERPETYLHCVSASQQRRCPTGARLLPAIENGIEVDAYRPRYRKMPFALALGRMCPEKGYHIALDAAARAGVACLIGGELFRYAAHVRYFRREVAWRLDGQRRRFLGPLGMERKRRLLAAAKCLLVPSLAPETSSLVAMEALACGTPVIAFPSGALADIVQHGKTGYLVRDREEMAEAIDRIDRLRGSDCRADAEARFSSHRMVREYLETYSRIAGRNRSAARVRRGLRARVLNSQDALASLESDWMRLFDNSPGATPFSSPQWLLPWWEVLGGAEPHIVTVHSADGLAGILPMYRFNGRLYAVGNGITDYLDCLSQPDNEADVARCLWEHLGSCDLRDVPRDSPLIRYAPARLRRSISEDSTCLVADLRNLEISSGLLSNLRYAERRLQQLGHVAIRPALPAELPLFMDRLFDLHGARWRTRGQTGVLADEALRQFHHLASRGLQEAGMLRLYGLYIDADLRAVLYCLSRNRRVHYYLSGYDPGLSQYSPGSLIIFHAMMAAVDAGDNEFDFLRGDEPYKRRWGALPRSNCRILIDCDDN